MPLSLSDRQGQFAAALADPSKPVPDGVLGREGAADARRFAVYRNNVAAGLIDTLATAFPVVARLVGGAFFRAMAGAYVAAHKPETPVLMEYGATFPDFVARFDPARPLPYLADMARLERAWVEAFHAAEAEPVTMGVLTAFAPDAIASVTFTPHPSARLVRSIWPVGSIWSAHQDDTPPLAPESWEPEDLLVVRPAAEVLIHRLPGGGAFVAALLTGAPLGEAAAAGHAEAPNFDLPRNLGGLFEAGAVIAVHPQEIPS